ncbi:16S rRNA (adenine(1518)-N(6)/adenine(1519)-N(6))-dimethyltransferase RsmA [Acidobacteria bacterium AH-259-D05]|nr:16S rRNA (adenine(1518)-N(6)/adenine(1519)-N(6))-dimethyltransferase RsmA [Acidobacteria bacterium AH-259-D05]
MKPRAKKSLGQHFLSNPEYCRKIAHFARIGPEDRVVEIGPGTGQLTKILIPLARAVIAIEFDRDLVQYLKDHSRDVDDSADRLTIIQGDVLTFNWSTIVGKKRFKVIGNLPYNISTPILQRMIEIKDRFQSGTFLVQKEVAQRILAVPHSKDYGFFSLLMEYHFQRMAGFDIPPGAFVPKPKVTSHVIQLIPRREPHLVPNYEAFQALLKNAFQQRRKTLWNNLKLNQSPEDIGRAFEACGIQARARPEEVTLEQYACLGRML